ncbi:hypothetical protein DVH05_024242 [Phytophthora capsici]|nr:hypothetical protein DVH05_024242 [Phytophthora capsici]
MISVRAQADAQRTRIANLEGQVGSSHQHELSVRRLESEKTALANDLEAEQRARADAESDHDRALREQADAEADRDRLLAERQTVQAQLSSLGSIFGVPVQTPPRPPSAVKGQSSRSQSVPSRKPSSSSSRKRGRRASSGTPRPKRSRTSPPVTRSSSGHPQAVTGSTTGGTPSRPIVLSEEEDAEAQSDPGNTIDGDQENSPGQDDHGDVDTQVDQDNSQDPDHADETPEDQKDQYHQGSPDNRGSSVLPATPPIIPGGNQKRPHGGSLIPVVIPATVVTMAAVAPVITRVGLRTATTEVQTPYLRMTRTTLSLRHKSTKISCPQWSRVSAGFLAIAEQPPTAGRAIVILGRCQRLAV